jgi:hypothetical protein
MILAVALAVTLQDIGWLAGDWQLTTGSQCIEEMWTAPSNNLLVGMSRTVAGGRTTSFEFVRIEARADASLRGLRAENARSISSSRRSPRESSSTSAPDTPIV